MSTRRKERSMGNVPRTTIGKLQSTYSGKIMHLVGWLRIPSTCTVNTSRKPSGSWRREFRQPKRRVKCISMCKYHRQPCDRSPADSQLQNRGKR